MFIPLISILALKRAFPLQLSRRINGYWWARKRYTDYLLSENVTWQAVDTLFSGEFNVAFTGSSLLKVLLNADWQSNDIDLAVIEPKADYTYFYHLGVIQSLYDQKCLAPITHQPEPTYLSNVTNCMEHYNDIPDMIVYVAEYQLEQMTEPKLQIIHIVQSFDEYVDSFDFNICANYLTADRLVVKHPYALLKGVPQEISGMAMSEKRVLKYQARGFTFKVWF